LQALLFDIDGTLVMGAEADGACFAEAFCAVFGAPAPSTDWGDYAYVTDWGILDQALGQRRGRASSLAERTVFETTYREAWARRFAADPTSCREVPGAAEMVSALLTHPEWVCGVATGGARGAATFKLSAVGIDPDRLPGAYANSAIPRAAIVWNALRSLGARREAVVYVGDGHWDVSTCRALGIRFVGVAAEMPESKLRDAGATQVIPDYRDVDAFRRAVADALPPV
jgi:beta-phosphoglucomutase-like phosphatase (HAD superfamily)